MMPYEQLDALKVCHELTLAVHRNIENIEDFDSELAADLWRAAISASARIARGAGSRNRRLLAQSLDRSLCSLCELDYLLNLARTLDLISTTTRRELEGLRGRAVFYVLKQLTSLEVPPPLPM